MNEDGKMIEIPPGISISEYMNRHHKAYPDFNIPQGPSYAQLVASIQKIYDEIVYIKGNITEEEGEIGEAEGGMCDLFIDKLDIHFQDFLQ